MQVVITMQEGSTFGAAADRVDTALAPHTTHQGIQSSQTASPVNPEKGDTLAADIPS